MNQYIFTPTGFYPDTQEKEILESRYETLYHMGFSRRSKEMSSSELFLYELSEAFFQCLTEMPELELTREATHVVPDEEHLEHLLSSVPYAIGQNILTVSGLPEYFCSWSRFFRGKFQVIKAVWNCTSQSRIRSCMYRRGSFCIWSLLSCLNRAAEVSDLIAELVESGEMFHVLRFTGKEAYQFLRDVEKIEQTGILCRIPNWWRKRAMECSVEIRLGEKKTCHGRF